MDGQEQLAAAIEASRGEFDADEVRRAFNALVQGELGEFGVFWVSDSGMGGNSTHWFLKLTTRGDLVAWVDVDHSHELGGLLIVAALLGIELPADGDNPVPDCEETTIAGPLTVAAYRATLAGDAP